MGECLLPEVILAGARYVRNCPQDMYSIARSLGLYVHYLPMYKEMLRFFVLDHQYQALSGGFNVDEAGSFFGVQCMSRAEDVHLLRTDGMKALCCVSRASAVHFLVDNFRGPSRYHVLSTTELAMKVVHIDSQAIYMCGYVIRW